MRLAPVVLSIGFGLAACSAPASTSSSEALRDISAPSEEPTVPTTITTTTAAPTTSTESSPARSTNSLSTPDSITVDDLVEFAAAVDAPVVVAREGERLLVVRNGVGWTLDAPLRRDAWSDGRFIYATERLGEQDSQTMVFNLDGVLVCEVGNVWVHHTTSREDGSFVVAAEASDAADEWNGERFEVPLDAVDCATGERQPIQPVSILGGLGDHEQIVRIGDRTFRVVSDAEGNGDVLNENGQPTNGQDYAGAYVFNEDASLIAYGHMLGSPHFTGKINVRDTNSTELLWSVTLDDVFVRIHLFNDTLLVHTQEHLLASGGDYRGQTALLFDSRSGEKLLEYSAPYLLLYVGS